MNSLIDKYRKDELTSEELSKLKTSTDENIEQLLYADWLNDNTDISFIDNRRINRLKNNIDVKLGRRRSRIASIARLSQIAAVLLLPISILLSFYLYRENNSILSDEMLVITDKSERASITLPDGTTISLNAESTLRYQPKSYNKKERKIKFSGEGYFRVRGNKDIPFLVNAKGLQIKVFGTIFNLSVRENKATAELALEEGCVSLLSIRNNQSVVLFDNQKAILNYQTGEITVITDEGIKDISAWQRGDMVFRNTGLAQVIRAIEENYNLIIRIDCPDILSDPFTGILPINNLNEVLEVIEHSYHVKAILNGKEIVIKRKH